MFEIIPFKKRLQKLRTDTILANIVLDIFITCGCSGYRGSNELKSIFQTMMKNNKDNLAEAKSNPFKIREAQINIDDTKEILNNLIMDHFINKNGEMINKIYRLKND